MLWMIGIGGRESVVMLNMTFYIKKNRTNHTVTPEMNLSKLQG